MNFYVTKYDTRRLMRCCCEVVTSSLIYNEYWLITLNSEEL